MLTMMMFGRAASEVELAASMASAEATSRASIKRAFVIGHHIDKG
jgi:hypothetical protein